MRTKSRLTRAATNITRNTPTRVKRIRRSSDARRAIDVVHDVSAGQQGVAVDRRHGRSEDAAQEQATQADGQHLDADVEQHLFSREIGRQHSFLHGRLGHQADHGDAPIVRSPQQDTDEEGPLYGAIVLGGEDALIEGRLDQDRQSGEGPGKNHPIAKPAVVGEVGRSAVGRFGQEFDELPATYPVDRKRNGNRQ
jgi:hypothetical protein